MHETSFRGESPLVVRALISYLGASVLFLMHVVQGEELLQRLGLYVCSLGLALNLAALGMRGVITDTVLLSNLYATALVFASGGR